MPRAKKESVVAKKEEVPKTEPAKSPDTLSYYEGIGRRKESTARVRLYVVGDETAVEGAVLQKGFFLVNDRPIETYFMGEVNKKLYLEPFRTTNTLSRFATTIRTEGGGHMGQLSAVILGISRALEKVDKDKFRPILKKRDFLTRDSRIKQRRKAGFAGKARARKQSPKR